jgi:hypothetical protein
MNKFPLFTFCNVTHNGNTVRRIVFAVLTAVWCGAIFYLSSQNGDTSSNTSGGFIRIFCELIVPEFSGFSGAERAEFVESLQFIVRKCAHFTAYLILASISVQFFKSFGRLKKKHGAFAAAMAFCVLYAASDEFHQYFVPGRSSQLRDVLIDSCGALCGLLITAGAGLLIKKFKS